jgi:hypothetical protein
MKSYFNMRNKGECRDLRCAWTSFVRLFVDCGLHDLGYSGDTYTWRNHNHTLEGYIRVRLDRAVGNLE